MPVYLSWQVRFCAALPPAIGEFLSVAWAAWTACQDTFAPAGEPAFAARRSALLNRLRIAAVAAREFTSDRVSVDWYALTGSVLDACDRMLSAEEPGESALLDAVGRDVVKMTETCRVLADDGAGNENTPG